MVNIDESYASDERCKSRTLPTYIIFIFIENIWWFHTCGVLCDVSEPNAFGYLPLHDEMNIFVVIARMGEGEWGGGGEIFVGWYTIINCYTEFASCSTRGNCAFVPSNINRNKLSLIISVFIDIFVGVLFRLHRFE